MGYSVLRLPNWVKPLVVLIAIELAAILAWIIALYYG